MFGFLFWCLLFVFCWLLVILVLVLWLLVWLVMLFFWLLGIVVDGVFGLLCVFVMLLVWVLGGWQLMLLGVVFVLDGDDDEGVGYQVYEVVCWFVFVLGCCYGYVYLIGSFDLE